MKTLVLNILLILQVSFGMCSNYSALITKIVSSEYETVNGTFSFDVEFEAKSDISFNQALEFELPDGWSANSNVNLENNSYNQGDTFNVNISVSYPVNDIPFYPQDVILIQHIENNGVNEQKETYAKIYFTPYETIEIWNPYDYNSQLRRWHHPNENPDAQREQIDKNEIPESNIDLDSLQNYAQTKSWDDDFEFTYVSIPGLAYDVMMKPRYKEEQDGTKTTFTGTVNGKFTAWTSNGLDLDEHVMIPLAGIKVRLMRKRALWTDEELGYTYTDENGEFSIYYNESISLLPPDEITLYLEFISKDDGTYEIFSVKPLGNNYTRRSFEWNASENAGTVSKYLTFTPSQSSGSHFKAIHWVRRGYQYFYSEGIPLEKGLKIRPGSTITWYRSPDLPGTSINTIHLEYSSSKNKYVTLHEFGHGIMDKLQGTFTFPYGENGVSPHRWNEGNSSSLAWSEGWANAMAMILNAVSREDYNGIYGQDLGSTYEKRKHFSWPDEGFDGINNGLRSEYYIACAIYDLWDGPGKGLPEMIPNYSDYSSIPDQHGWKDRKLEDGEWVPNERGWESIDDVELELIEICQPLIEHPTDDGIESPTTCGGYFGEGKIENIQDYYLFLLDLVDDCNIKADISRTFRENRVLWNIPEYEWGWNYSCMSSDFINEPKYKDEQGYLHLDISGYGPTSASWTDTWVLNFLNENTSNSFEHSAWSDVDYNITDPLRLGIQDEYSDVYRESELFLNNQFETVEIIQSAEHGDYETCGGVDIDVRNGKLELGGSETTASLTINDGSKLFLREHGELVVNDNSTLIIECGATLVYQEGASIVLNGDNAQIIIKGNLEIGNNAVFAFDGTGSLKKMGPPDIVIPQESTGSSFIVESGLNVTLVAQNSIRLKPGFHAKSGSSFRAYIDPSIPECDETSNTMLANSPGSSNNIYEMNSDIQTSDYIPETKDDSLSNIKAENALSTKLFPNYPNPCSDLTIIKYRIGENCPVNIFLTNMQGQKVAELENNKKHPVGEFEIEFIVSEFNPGVYFYTLQTNNHFQTRRMVVQ
jgi:hypothetical protein